MNDAKVRENKQVQQQGSLAAWWKSICMAIIPIINFKPRILDIKRYRVS